MTDEVDRLRAKPNLLLLLTHYANLGREAWQDRLMTMEGVEAPELSKLHGELIAFSWIDQNTGDFSVVRAVPYQIATGPRWRAYAPCNKS